MRKNGLIIGLLLLLLLLAGAVLFWRGAKKAESSDCCATLLEQGWTYFRIGEYASALRSFAAAQELAHESKDPELEQYISYSLATLYWLRSPGSDPERAAGEFRALLEEAPQGKNAPWCRLALVRIKHLVNPGQTPNYAELFAEYLSIYQDYPAHPAGHEALLFRHSTMLAQFSEEQTKLAREEMRAFIAANPDTSYISTVWRLLARAEEFSGNYNEALQALIHSLYSREADPANPRQDSANAYWELATYAEFMVGDFQTARRFYRLLQNEYPRDRRNFGAKRALERMQKLEDSIRAEAGKATQTSRPAGSDTEMVNAPARNRD